MLTHQHHRGILVVTSSFHRCHPLCSSRGVQSKNVQCMSTSQRRSRISNKSIKSNMNANAPTPPPSPFQFKLTDRLNGLDKPTVWHEFSPLATEHNAINLGQGFPDWDPPQFALSAMETSIDPSSGRNANQYARSYAHLPLAAVLAEDYTAKLGREENPIDPVTEVATAVGCTNALFCALMGMIGPGDEVLLLEPAFDVYIAQTKFAGGLPVFIPLRTEDDDVDNGDNTTQKKTKTKEKTKEKGKRMANDTFKLDLQEFENAITDKTKAFILNTPHNPTGKMFTRSEMEAIASILQKYPHITVISDEVYEHIVFDQTNSPHISMASLPGMYDRTLTLSSSGKTFSATGWKVGWAVGPKHLVKAVTAVQQWVNFSAPTPNQDAIAQCLIQARKPYKHESSDGSETTTHESFYAFVAEEYKRKRGLLVDGLITAGMDPIVPNGGFFIMADTSDITFPQSYMEEKTVAMPCDPMPRDWAMSRWLTKEVGVTAIPPSAFYGESTVHLAKDLLRFAYCKGDDTILEAHERLKKYFQK